jgi:hypothetical protein
MTQEEHPPTTEASPPTERLPSVERLILVVIAATMLLVAAAVVWRLSAQQALFIYIGVVCLALAWMVWRHGIIGYSHSEGPDIDTGEVKPPTTTVIKSPLPREVLTPLLVVGALVFVLAATRTGVGAALSGPARVAVSSWNFVHETYTLLFSTVAVLGLVGALVYEIVRRGSHAVMAGLCLVAFLAFAFAANYAVYLSDKAAWRQAWNDFLKPARTLVGLFS